MDVNMTPAVCKCSSVGGKYVWDNPRLVQVAVRRKLQVNRIAICYYERRDV